MDPQMEEQIRTRQRFRAVKVKQCRQVYCLYHGYGLGKRISAQAYLRERRTHLTYLHLDIPKSGWSIFGIPPTVVLICWATRSCAGRNHLYHHPPPVRLGSV